jgi:hypothetical protein
MVPFDADHPDARLMAAAPDLLEALNGILENELVCTCDGICDGECWRAIGQKAIAKATGK